MAIFGKKEQERISQLEYRCAQLETQNNYLREQLNISKSENEKLREDLKLGQLEKNEKLISELENSIRTQQQKSQELDDEISEKTKQLAFLDELYDMQEIGLHSPQFEFETVEEYRTELQQLRKMQMNAQKEGRAILGNLDWTVNGNKTEGRRMVKDIQKLILRAFNNECDYIISKVRVDNYESSVDKMTSTSDAISKFGRVLGIYISPYYFNLKLKEIDLALKYRLKKEDEKERIREMMERRKEEERIQKEIEEDKRKQSKEKKHFEQAISDINLKIETCIDDSIKQNLLEKKEELELKLEETIEKIEDLDYRETNLKAGYVYIISNLGSFGENVYKIGMTRRLKPEDRVYELGDASVPFRFDIHAMIFTEDAPALENALHKAFELKKVNMVNTRREFFRVTLDEIKQVVKENFDKTVEFIDIPPAEEYWLSETMRQELMRDAGLI